MSNPRYLWRKLTTKQRDELLKWRKDSRYPWHSPPHRPNFGHLRFLISAACYEHRHYIGWTPGRMHKFSEDLLAILAAQTSQIFAWCLLPNHYHVLVEASDVKTLLGALGHLHGRTLHAWNGEENKRGRKVFFRAVERAMRSDRHFWSSLNYIHHNPVHHRYVKRWTDWPWSSAAEYLARSNTIEAKRVWQNYPVLDYGKNWDEPEM